MGDILGLNMEKPFQIGYFFQPVMNIQQKDGDKGNRDHHDQAPSEIN